MTDEQEKAFRAAVWRNWGDICWRCGGKGYWHEQIDGPDNLRTVYCDCDSAAQGKKP